MKRLLFLALTLLESLSICAQTAPANNQSEFELQYERRIKKEYLNGVYIPKDLTDAFIQLNRLIDKDSKSKFKSVPDTLAARKLHFSLGRWMMHNWSFYEGSRLTVSLNRLNLHHPDDMARFVIIAYHRNLNRQPLEVKKLVTLLLEKRTQLEIERQLKGELIQQEVRKLKKDSLSISDPK